MTTKIIDSVIEKLQSILSSQKTTVSPQANIQRDLGLDSLAVATLVYELSEEIDFEIDYVAENFATIKTVADLADTLEKAMNA